MIKKYQALIINKLIPVTLFLWYSSDISGQIPFDASKKESNVTKTKDNKNSSLVLAEIKEGIQAFLNSDYIRSFALLGNNKDAVEMDGEAFFDLAYMYEKGLGVGRDINEAIVCYKKAADKGDIIAKFAFERLENKLPIATDDVNKAAISLANLEINDGKSAYFKSQYSQSHALLYKNKDSWQMDGEAFFDLAQMYERGLGVDKNIDEAITYYKKAADKGDFAGKLALERLTRKSLITLPKKEIPISDIELIYIQIKQGKQAFLNKNYSQSFELLNKNKEAIQMDGEAFFDLASMYEKGLGVRNNISEALFYYKKAALKGDLIAKFAFERLKGGLSDEASINDINLAKKAYSVANYTLAFQLLFGNRYSLFFDSEAQFLLAYMYETGRGIEKDNKLAAMWYRQAADEGNTAAQNNLGLMYEMGQGVEKDYNQAILWYSKAAEQGFARAQNNLGFMYETGKGIRKNDSLSIMWYHKGAKQGDPEAQNNLGRMYKYGQGVEKNAKEAVMWYLMAAEQGYSTGQLNMGLMYETGQGVKKNIKRAFLWYSRAAKLGNPLAQNNLGFMYEYGHGVAKNLNKAIEFYQEAARQGSSDAQQSLKRLNEMF